MTVRGICHSGLSFLVFLAFLSPMARAADDEATAKHLLQYRFKAGEELRWDVVHRKMVRTTYGGSTQATEAVSRSTKCWRVVEVNSEGAATFESLVEDVDMRQKLPGSETISYNSKKDETPPPGFVDAAKRVGRPLARVTLDRRGKTLKRTSLMPEAVLKEMPELTIPLPEEPVAVGESWRERHEVKLPLENGATKTILTEQVFTLKSVQTGVATIEVANQVLTPIHSPAIEAKLIERYSRGTVRFDMEAGRVLSQQMDLDRRVVGFRGDDSSLHHLTRFTENLIPAKPEGKVAGREADRK
ncbi:MAG TPA: hypothetical protein DD670_05520 [Planctomycetaceae bacterium]|nr:hypothetical protein [Planctomycetaceae bacterium]